MNRVTMKLVCKDLSIMKIPALLWWLFGLISIAAFVFGGSRMINFALILFISGMAGAGIHAVMSTVLLERREKTMGFIMALPITITQYNTAKLTANLLIFSATWIPLSLASCLMAVHVDVIPLGIIPFLIIIFVGILLANIIVLSVSLITETMGGAVAAITCANIGTQVYMSWIYGLDGIQSTVRASRAVWNSTVITVLGSQAGLIVILILFTYVFQANKKDFI